MDIEKIIREYLAGLEEGNYSKLLNLFSEDATIHSPLSGSTKASKFYRDLLNDTKKSEIELINIFTKKKDEKIGAGHFIYNWVLKDGTEVSFECVDIFQFSENGKIEELKIIYDTYGPRQKYERMTN